MLHSSLPRAFLTPELNYLSYYSDEVHQHSYTVIPSTTWQISMQSPSSSSYSRIPEHRLTLQSNWDSSRSSTPCPLDLSLKPPPTPNTPKTEEIIEVNDERDERVSEDDERRSENEMYGMLLLDDSSIHDRRSYEQLLSKKEFVESQSSPEKIRIFEEAARLVSQGSNNDIPSKYHAQNQKVLLTSPSSLQSVHGYHQQLLLTPQQHYLQGMQHAPMTPPSTPSPPQCPRRRVREEEGSPVAIIAGSGVSSNAARQTDTASDKALQRPKKKHARRLKFDEDTSSPVSGTVILGPDEAVVTGDIDPAFNIVEVTEEARAELAKIENRLGPYQCKLCRQLHEDAFQLAQHRCSRIAHVEYRCPECDKRFSCPANLASHRRWHKPRLLSTGENPSASSIEIPCTRCEAKFTRQAALRKHLATQHPEVNNNTNVGSSGNTSNTNTAGTNNNDNRVLLEAQETIGKADAAHLSAIDNGPSTEMP